MLHSNYLLSDENRKVSLFCQWQDGRKPVPENMGEVK